MLETPLRTRSYTEPEKMQRIVRELLVEVGLEQASRKGRTPWPKNYESNHHYALESDDMMTFEEGSSKR